MVAYPHRRPRRASGAAHAKLIDVRQARGRERVIGCWDLGGAIVDPGPESAAGALRGSAPCWSAHPPRPRGRDRGARGAFPELGRAIARGAPHARPRAQAAGQRGAHLGRAGRRATLWGRVVPVRSATCACSREGRRSTRWRAASSTSSTRPGTPPRRLLRPSDGTAYVGDVAGVRIPPRTSSGRRRRPTSTSVWQLDRPVAARDCAPDALRHGHRLEHERRERPGRAGRARAHACSSEHDGDTDAAGGRVRRRR